MKLIKVYLFSYIDDGTDQSYKNDTKIQDIPTVSEVILEKKKFVKDVG